MIQHESFALTETRFLSLSQVARVCGVSRNTTYAWVRQGKLDSFTTPGRRNLVRPGQLVRFMERNGMYIPPKLILLAQEDQGGKGSRGGISAALSSGEAPAGPSAASSYSLPAAARLCGVRRYTVWRWVREGKVPATRSPRQPYSIFAPDLARFMKVHGMFVPPELTSLAPSPAAAGS